MGKNRLIRWVRLYSLLSAVLTSTSCFSDPMVKDTFPSKSHFVLPEINIKGNTMMAKRRGDTIIFDANRYKTVDAIKLDQLLNKVPGFQVDGQGRISFNGKPIQKLMLDGDDLTAENYQLISRHLRSLMIDSIQVLEQYHANRLLKNTNEQNGIAINLVLKQSYYGKPTLQLIGTYALSKQKEIQLELIYLRKRAKIFSITNMNNTGTVPLKQRLHQETYMPPVGEELFYSWPKGLENNLTHELESRYVNENNDWGVALASSFKLNAFKQIRINVSRSNASLAAVWQQQQLFLTGFTLPLSLYLTSRQIDQLKETSLVVHLQTDRGKKSTSNFQFQIYHQNQLYAISEERKMLESNRSTSSSTLSSKGGSIRFDKTWKLKDNLIMQGESIINASDNYYAMMIQFDTTIFFDTVQPKALPTLYHKGIHSQHAIGLIHTYKKSTLRYWVKSSYSGIYSIQGGEPLDIRLFKNYMQTHLTTHFSKKLTTHFQSLFGSGNIHSNKVRYSSLIYHLDHAVFWRRKATQSFSLHYGLLRRPVDVRHFFAGPLFQQATVQLIAPDRPVFPFSMYNQFQFSVIDLYRGLTIHTQLVWKKEIDDYYTSIDLFPLYTKLTPLSGGSQTTISTNVNIEKILYPLRLKYRVQFNAMRFSYPAQLNGWQLTTNNQVYSYTNHLATNWKKGYNFQMEYQNFIAFNHERSIQGWRNRSNVFKAMMQLQVKQQFSADITLQRFAGKEITSLHLLDVKLNYSRTARYRIYVTGTNLVNQSYYERQVINANSKSTIQSRLVGRRIAIGIDLSL